MTTALTALITLWLSALPLAQTDHRPTIPETIRLVAPQPVLSTRQTELLPPTLAEMAPKADLVVRGTLAPVRTYLSVDQKDLYTDYVLTPVRVLVQRMMQTSQAPGASAPITVKQWGGTTTIDGVPVTLVDLDIPAFRAGEDVFLLLSYDKTDGKFSLTGGAGAFTVSENHIQPRIEHPNYQRYVGMTSQQFEAELQQVLR